MMESICGILMKFNDALGGSLAASAATYALYPLEVLRVRDQASLQSDGVTLSKDTLYRVASLYSSPSLGLRLSHTLVDSFLYYVLFSKVQGLFTQQKSPSGRLSMLQHFILSQLSSMVVVICTRPIERLIYRMQTTDDVTSDSCTDISIQSLIEEAFYSSQGIAPSLLLCVNPAIHYTVYDTLKSALLDNRFHSAPLAAMNTGLDGRIEKRNISAIEAFVIGMISKAVATLITYPLIRAKVIMMSTDGAVPPIDIENTQSSFTAATETATDPSISSESRHAGKNASCVMSEESEDCDRVSDSNCRYADNDTKRGQVLNDYSDAVLGDEDEFEDEEVVELDDITKQRVAAIPWVAIPESNDPPTRTYASSHHRASEQSIHISNNGDDDDESGNGDAIDRILTRIRKRVSSLHRQPGPLGDVARMFKVLRFLAMVHGVPSLWQGLSLHLLHTVLRDALSMEFYISKKLAAM